jgi:hypothetical protein
MNIKPYDMKKIIISLGVLFIVLASFTHAQSPFLTYKFANPVIKTGSSDTLIFDVQVKCDVTGTYHTELSVYLNYNTLAFGSNVAANGKISLMRSGLTADELIPGSGIYKYNFLPVVDNSISRVAFGTEPALGYSNLAYLSLVPNTFITYVKVKLVIANNSQLAGLNFQASLMNGNQFYETVINNPIPYGTCVFDNNFNSLPLNPNTNLMFSEIGDPSNTTTNFVEIYNAGASTVNFDLYYDWYLSVNGTSSVKLTGSLAAGAKYTVAYNNTDFTPTLISTIIGTGGTAQYLLSTYGDYSTGTAIDKYNGSATGIDFTGKHAVRHYNIASPNTTFTPAEWVVSPAFNTDMTPGSHHSVLNWDGVPDSEWRAKLNWAEGFIPDAGHNVSITNIGATPMITDGDNAYCHNLVIGAGAGLIIESDVTTNGDGSLITYGTVTGTASVKRFLAANRYWYISQPVTSAVAGVFLHTWMFTYNEPGSNWGAFIEPEATPLVLMKGYAVWTSSINPWHQGWDPVGDTTVAYVGTLNTGAISTPLTKGGNGWNFVGNPYPSAVDWNIATGWTKSGLVTNAFWVWNGTSYSTYVVGGGGSNTATQYIPAAQGFFVQASTAGTLGVTDAVRTHSTQDFWKSDENMMNRLSMTVSNGVVNDETVIYFNENATSGLDYDYDAHKLIAPASPQAYTMLADEQMAINTFNNTNQTPTVVLGINAPEAGDYTMTASNIESFDASTPIYLEDLLTGQKINLREMSSYTFTAGEGTAERFVVHFADYQGIGVDPVSEVNSIYAVNGDIYVDFNSVKGEISIYNILGQEISHSAANNGLNMISVPQGNAVYIVKVISDNTTVTKKVFVK